MDKALSGRLIAAGDNLVFCELEGQNVILNLEDGVYYGLDPIGSFIWNLIQSPREFNEIRHMILEEYDVDDDRCRKDLSELLNDLAAKWLVVIRSKKDK